MQKTKNVMKGLTAKEEEIMGWFWQKGPLFVKELLEYYEEPKPHFNTLSTIVRGLEEKKEKAFLPPVHRLGLTISAYRA